HIGIAREAALVAHATRGSLACIGVAGDRPKNEQEWTMKTLHRALGVCAAVAAIGSVGACGTEASPDLGTSSAKVSHHMAPVGGPSVACSETEALSLLRLQHLRALHLAFAVRERLTDPEMRGFVDRVVEEHMSLVHEIERALDQRGGERSEGRMMDSLAN